MTFFPKNVIGVIGLGRLRSNIDSPLGNEFFFSQFHKFQVNIKRDINVFKIANGVQMHQRP